MGGHGMGARRVFLSHTSELREHPAPMSFVAAAEDAVCRAGDAVVDMAYFSASNSTSAELCRQRVREAEVYVLIAGFRYGSPVLDQEAVSYTELEFQTATSAGMPRLVFLIDEDADGPARMFRDLEYGHRQEAFRARLTGEAGLVIASVSSPERLGLLLHQALTSLSRASVVEVPVGRVWNIPPRVPEFIGRTGLLDELSAALVSGGRVVVHALTGMGGVGKSSTAIEYAVRHHDQFDIAWWIRAEDPGLVPDQLAALAHALNLADPTDPAPLALERLRAALHRLERWLVVFDNAEDPRALAPLLPAGPGRVLITSRNQHWRGTAAPLGLGEFTRGESIALLRTLAPHLSESDAERVADAVGDLPLAIDQAGSLLASTPMDVETYLRLLAERAEDAFGYDPAGAYPVSVTASWALAFERLDATSPIALRLLFLLAWLAPEPVPLTLITDNPETLPEDLGELARDPLAISRSVTLLTQRGLVTHTAAGLLLHRVPAALLRARTQTSPGPRKSWPLEVLDLMDTALPASSRGDDPSEWSVWQQLLPHALAVTSTTRHPDPNEDLAQQIALLLYRIGRYRRSQGETSTSEYEQGRDLNQAIYTRRRDALGEDHPKTLSSAQALAVDLWALGEHAQARELDQDTLTRRRRVLGKDHPNTRRSERNLDAVPRAGGEVPH